MEARVANHNEYRSLEGPGTVFSLDLYSMWRTTWLVPGNPFAPLGLNSNYDIHSTTGLTST